MGAQQGKERGGHSSGSHGGAASCIGVSSSSPVGTHVNNLVSVGLVGGSGVVGGGSLSGGSVVGSGGVACVSSNSNGGSVSGNALGVGSTLRCSRIKSSGSGAAMTGGLTRSTNAISVNSAGPGSAHSTKDNRCNPIGLNIFTEHNGKC